MTPTSTENAVVERLRSIPIFAGLGPSDLEMLARMVTLRRFRKGARIIARNDHGDTMFLLVAGRVKECLLSSDGRELTLNYVEAPAHFGELSLVDAGPRATDVVAVTDVEALTLEGRELSAAIRLQPRLALSLIGTLSRRLRQTINRLEDLSFHDASHRVKRVLFNVATASYDAIGVPMVSGLTHYEIGTLAGTSRETASRVISSLAKRQVVIVKGRRVIVDLYKLRDELEAAKL
jgi:CRP/FNR family cyclic AMP-dependent transcriptional regulator